MWFRRDLRRSDNPALLAAVESASAAGAPGVLPLFIVEPPVVSAASGTHLAYLAASLRSLRADLGGLHVRVGDAAEVLADLAGTHDGIEVHQAREYTPNARQQQDRVAAALATAGGRSVVTGSPYAVAPGRVQKADGSRYQVFTPYHRAWLAHGWRAPAPAPQVPIVEIPGSQELPDWEVPAGMQLLAAGEQAARERWAAFRETGLAHYPELRDRPDLPGTSLVSTPLRFGEVHPRTLLADLRAAPDAAHQGAAAFTRELAWREFFADVLHHRPDTVTANLNAAFDAMAHDTGPEVAEDVLAWREGRTGFPLVDAGMRELASTGLMHNRVRMVVASFLIKDLHQPWWVGAQHFMDLLLDGDLASNTHNWQWVAGCGADAAPYYRIFNPVMQGLKFDPQGDYVRRYVPELRHIPGREVHTPWERPDGYRHGYPRRIVDHAQEREESLRRYQELRTRG